MTDPGAPAARPAIQRRQEKNMTDRRTEGLYGKFDVRRTDGTDAPGEKHDGCTYFVLDLQHDKHMPAALRAYAASCEKDYPVLASQLRIVANDFGSRAEFAGIMAQKPALDLERQRAAALDAAPATTPEMILKVDDLLPQRQAMLSSEAAVRRAEATVRRALARVVADGGEERFITRSENQADSQPLQSSAPTAGVITSPAPKFVPDEMRERNIARDLRHAPMAGEGSGGWVMTVRYLVEALAAARSGE